MPLESLKFKIETKETPDWEARAFGTLMSLKFRLCRCLCLKKGSACDAYQFLHFFAAAEKMDNLFVAATFQHLDDDDQQTIVNVLPRLHLLGFFDPSKIPTMIEKAQRIWKYTIEKENPLQLH